MPQKRTLKAISKELIDTPFFPLLFFAEFVKELATMGDFLLVHGALAVASLVVWVLSDAIEVDVSDGVIGGESE